MAHQITLWSVWEKSIYSLKEFLGEVLWISFAGMLVPNIIFQCLSALIADGVAHELRGLAASSQSSFSAFAEPFSLGVVKVFALESLLSLSYALTFASLVYVLQNFYTQIERPSAGLALKYGLRFLFPTGIVLSMGMGLLSVEKIFFGSFRVFTIFALMAFILIVYEGRSALSGLWRALHFRYARDASVGGGFSAALILVSLGALAYLFEESLGSVILSPLFSWMEKWSIVDHRVFSGLPLGFLELLKILIKELCSVGAVVFSAAITTTLYFLTMSKDRRWIETGLGLSDPESERDTSVD